MGLNFSHISKISDKDIVNTIKNVENCLNSVQIKAEDKNEIRKEVTRSLKKALTLIHIFHTLVENYEKNLK